MSHRGMQITNIDIRHASEAVAKRARAWFASGGNVGAVDGSRSIHLPHPERSGFTLKIKGAGLNGGAIRFGTHCGTGPTALCFDFEGRAVEDVASGHDAACLGGASFQQACVEYRVTRRIESLGLPVVPCLGYGRIDTAHHSAWFSLFDWHRGWSSVAISRAGSMADYLQANRRLTEAMLHLATAHDLIGYCGLVRTEAGEYLLKDLHPFRQLDAISGSQLSWVMQVMFTLNIRCQAIRHFPVAAARDDVPADIVVHALRPVLPDVAQDDYEAMRDRIVKPYMRLPVQAFDPRMLVKALRETRIGNALMDLCPVKYARW